MLSLDEAMQLDFTAGLQLLGTDVSFGFGFDTMTCGAGASPVEALTKAYGNEEEEELRRLRRKISNRESARRSRARRRQRVEELERAVQELRAERRALAAKLDAAAGRALDVRCDNARLSAEAGALRRRLGEAQRHAVLLLALARARLARTASGGGLATAAAAWHR
ncbi:transcription factor HBP-1a-like [Phragmites australis]|uniref:transcription factor HBP-1a-like n=1 Tax=Phragmites australis TaxID=29695 RepID=UPI002D78EAF9|nr:transcription factor HBP-1a-like [Phragmites australis]